MDNVVCLIFIPIGRMWISYIRGHRRYIIPTTGTLTIHVSSKYVSEPSSW